MLDSFLPIMKAVVYMAYVEKLFFCIMYIYWKEINMNSETKYSILDLSLSNVHSTTRVKTDSQYKTSTLRDFNNMIKMISQKRILCYFPQLNPRPPFGSVRIWNLYISINTYSAAIFYEIWFYLIHVYIFKRYVNYVQIHKL